MTMAQDVALETQPDTPAEKLHEALLVCKSCRHVVPKTMVCIYCGSPILFIEPRQSTP
jgi:rRNA maturation endonuclease Nob1